VTLLLKTIHLDKAGETWSVRKVRAEVADVDDEGTVVLVTKTDVPMTMQVDKLFPKHPPETPPEKQTFLAGHEIFRNFHPRVGEPHTTRRWLDFGEIEELLAERRGR